MTSSRIAIAIVAMLGGLLAVPVVAGAAPAASQASAFSGKAAVRSVEAKCVTAGRDRGRVVVEVRVRYPDVAGSAARRFANGRHQVRSSIRLIARDGDLLASDLDRGTARVAIPLLSSYVHVHQHRLGRSASRRVLGGRTCGKGAPPYLAVRVRATQRLSSAARASAAATASQTAGATVPAAVTPAASVAPVVNGCQIVGQDTNCHGANLDGQNLMEAALPYSDFSFATMEDANLQGARLGHVIMNQTVLDGANMTGALLGVASLSDASLQNTILSQAEMPFANLANAKFTGAHLEGVPMEGANLVGTVFDNTTCDGSTSFPTAFPHRCANGLIVSG
jgi:hypothetical protein